MFKSFHFHKYYRRRFYPIKPLSPTELVLNNPKMASGGLIFPQPQDTDYNYLDLVNISWAITGLGELDQIALTLYLVNHGDTSDTFHVGLL